MADVSLWKRATERVRRLVQREPRAGRWIEGSKGSVRGIVGFAWWRWPSRSYRLYVPPGWSRLRRAPLIVLCHGCHQTAETFAAGTRIAALADRLGALVLMPQQKDGANPYRCWNWFDPGTVAGRGEAAIVAAMVRSVRRWRRADADRIVIAGISAGGALAAIMALRYPSLVRAAFIHSGVACGAASSPFTALTVMGRGPDTDIAAIARSARATAGTARMPIAIVHGKADERVSARNAAALARQFLAFAGVALPGGSETTLPEASSDTRDTGNPLRSVRTREWRDREGPVVRLVEIDGLAHAWSGGDASLPYNDPAPPDATAMLGAWLSGLPVADGMQPVAPIDAAQR